MIVEAYALILGNNTWSILLRSTHSSDEKIELSGVRGFVTLVNCEFVICINSSSKSAIVAMLNNQIHPSEFAFLIYWNYLYISKNV